MDAIDIAQLITSGTALAALGAAIWQVRSSRLQAQNETTHTYIARLSEADFVKHLARSMDALRVDDPSPEGTADPWHAFQTLNHERQLDIAAPFNAFESIAGLYNLDHLNRELVERQLGRLQPYPLVGRANARAEPKLLLRVGDDAQRLCATGCGVMSNRGAWHTSRR